MVGIVNVSVSIRLQATAIEAANSRDTQNSSQMYTFLITSITDGMLGKVIFQREQYTYMTGFLDGPSLLKVLVSTSPCRHQGTSEPH
jgi:hypothetical protein